jgi:uncharacterized protein DUF4062
MSPNLHVEVPFELRGSSVVIRAQTTRPFSSVFVSSTRRDLEAERQQIKLKVLKRLQVACLLGEEMVSGYVRTVDKCLEEVDAAAGFIGVFAYWYGSVLDEKQQVSITHMEFRRALERLEQKDDLPMLILMPKEPSAVKTELEERALKLIGEDEAKRKEHTGRLKLFHEEVKGGGRIVQEFETCEDLYELILVKCTEWKGLTLMRAAQGEVEVQETTRARRQPTEEELGLLGRGAHFKAGEDALALAPAFPEEPALAFLLSGDEDAGQRAFLQRLLTTAAVRAGRPPRILRPPYEQCDPASLVHLIGDGLGLTGVAGAAEPTTTHELAEAIHAGLQQQQLCFVLDQAHRIAGGAAAFREQFWLPLYTRLKELRAERPTEHRLLGFVADYAGRAADDWGDAARPHDDAAGPDYSRLLLLPALAPFTKIDLPRWMNDLCVPDRPLGRRAALSDAVLKTAGGQPDGTPRRVFQRLSDEDLWPEGEER